MFNSKKNKLKEEELKVRKKEIAATHRQTNELKKEAQKARIEAMKVKREANDLRKREIEHAENLLSFNEKVQSDYLRQQSEKKAAGQLKFAPPELMKGVMPDGKTAPIATDSCDPVYAYLNNMDASFFSTFEGYPALAVMTQSSDYRSVPETTAEEMTREWGEIIIDTEDDDKQEALQEKKHAIEEAMRDHGIQSKIRRLIELDGFFGRAALFVDLGQQDNSIPLMLDKNGVKKGSLKGFTVIDPIWTTPSVFNADNPLDPSFYRPSKWYVMGKEVHDDRLLTVIMRPVPDMLKPAYNFGGMPMLQLMKPYVQRYQRMVDSVAEMVSKFSLTILATDMQNIISGQAPASHLGIRSGVMAMERDNSGVVMVDKEVEDILQINTPLTGLADLVQQANEAKAAPSKTPLVKLLGLTPAGLNANSDGEIRVYYDHINAEQQKIKHHVQTIVDVIQLNLYGEIEPTLRFEFKSLYQLNLKEQAEAQEIKSRTAATLIASGALSQEEARTALTNDDDSDYQFIDASVIPVQETYDDPYEEVIDNV